MGRSSIHSASRLWGNQWAKRLSWWCWCAPLREIRCELFLHLIYDYMMMHVDGYYWLLYEGRYWLDKRGIATVVQQECVGRENHCSQVPMEKVSRTAISPILTLFTTTAKQNPGQNRYHNSGSRRRLAKTLISTDSRGIGGRYRGYCSSTRCE